MPVEINRTQIYTAKYIDDNGQLMFMDLTATGMTDAKDQLKKRGIPNEQVINVWRKL
jgi:hypothetical protein